MKIKNPEGRLRLMSAYSFHLSIFTRGGFTLIELLVAVAIIIILLGCLFRQVQKLRESARQAVCAGNVRQLCSAMNLATADNDGAYLALVSSIYMAPSQWDPADVLAPYLGTSDGKIWHCPSDSGKGIWAYSFPNQDFSRSYSFNTLFVNDSYGLSRKLVSIEKPSTTVLVCENWTGWGPHQINGIDADTIVDQQGRGGKSAVMHGGQNAATFGFVDGHAQMLRWLDVSPTGIPGRGMFGLDSSSRDGL